jgi:phage-related protein
MPSINDSITNWVNFGSSYQFTKNDIVKHYNNFYYAVKDHEKGGDNTTRPLINNGNNNFKLNLEYWDGVTILQDNSRIPKFFWTASYTSTTSHKPLITVIRFGNGYEQRINKNINPDLKTFQLKFELKTEKEAYAIVHFLQDKAATKAFAYDPPTIYSEQTYRTRYVCREWETNFNFKENYTINAKFDEVSG